MKYGVCCGPDRFGFLAGSGYSYAEPPLAALRGLDDDALRGVRDVALRSGIAIEGFNCFFGGDAKLCSDPADSLLAYAKRNFETANILGASYCVIGSGVSRRIPDESLRPALTEKYLDVFDRIASLGSEHGVRVFFEPLCSEETNFCNTLTEGLEFVRRVGNANLGLVADLYHFYVNGEDLREFDELKPGELSHVHIARPDPDRGYLREENRETFEKWGAKLRETGYDGNITIECTFGKDFEAEIRASRPMLELFGSRGGL